MDPPPQKKAPEFSLAVCRRFLGSLEKPSLIGVALPDHIWRAALLAQHCVRFLLFSFLHLETLECMEQAELPQSSSHVSESLPAQP